MENEGDWSYVKSLQKKKSNAVMQSENIKKFIQILKKILMNKIKH